MKWDKHTQVLETEAEVGLMIKITTINNVPRMSDKTTRTEAGFFSQGEKVA